VLHFVSPEGGVAQKLTQLLLRQDLKLCLNGFEVYYKLPLPLIHSIQIQMIDWIVTTKVNLTPHLKNSMASTQIFSVSVSGLLIQ
jgi:hypothetical protein